jgi:RNA-directed DNA polymerase
MDWRLLQVNDRSYADDNVLGFQYQTDADRFLVEFRKRLGKFGLELHPDKTRLIEFGEFAERDRQQKGEGKPEMFDFLGLTHIKREGQERQLRAKAQNG